MCTLVINSIIFYYYVVNPIMVVVNTSVDIHMLGNERSEIQLQMEHQCHFDLNCVTAIVPQDTFVGVQGEKQHVFHVEYINKYSGEMNNDSYQQYIVSNSCEVVNYGTLDNSSHSKRICQGYLRMLNTIDEDISSNWYYMKWYIVIFILVVSMISISFLSTVELEPEIK